MTGLVLTILFGLIFWLFPCEGQIALPPGGDTFVVLPGENVTITWKLDVSIDNLVLRSWTFLSKHNVNNFFARIIQVGGVTERQEYSPGPFTIKKNSTLILKNVTTEYNGTYRFFVSTNGASDSSDVTVFVAVTPAVTVNCSNLTTLNASDYFACECKGQGGNPPADVTWYKGNEENDVNKCVTGKEEAILRLHNVSKDDNGTYTCVAKSHEEAKSTETIELIVNYPPENVTLTLTWNSEISVTITCTAEAHPAPSFEIFFNKAGVRSDKMYYIPKVMDSHVGYYTCVAWNILGNKTSNSEYLSLEVKPMKTEITITPNKAEVGKSVNIMCNSEGRPEPMYNIIHIDTDMLRIGKTYNISEVKWSDAGTYKCIAKNKLGNESHSTHLTVEGKPVNTTIVIKPTTVEVGKSVNITCDSKGPPEPRYNITHDSTIVSTEKNYTISKVNMSHAGTYKCIAWNKLGNDSDSDNLTVIFEVKPHNTSITIKPENVILWGGPVVITCDSEGIPEPTYTITHDGTVVSTGKKYTISTVGLSDGGTYECIATNKRGSDSASGDLGVVIWPLVLLVIGVVLLVVVIIAVVIYCYLKLKKEKRDGYKGNANVSPGASGALAVELDEEPAGGVDNAYDTVSNPGASGSKSKPPENTTPAVYAAVDKKNKEGKPLYATLDSLALEQVDNSKKKRDEERPGQSEYASIDFGKIGKVDEE